MRYGALVSVILLSCFFSLCAYSVPVQVEGTRITVYPPEEVLTYCRPEQDRLILYFKTCYPWTLDQTQDSVFPMDANQVMDAIQQIDYPLDRVVADVLILPFLRMEIPKSSAEGSIILLSPGVSPYSDQHVHYTAVHEVGHIVQHQFMPETAKDLWKEYLGLRGIEYDACVVSPKMMREMFAEDFRLLFGGELARLNGSSAIKVFDPPQEVPNLREFMLGLPDRVGWGLIQASPNPFRDSVAFRFTCLNLQGAVLRIFNSQGRLITKAEIGSIEDGILSWDGSSNQGQQVSPGVYFVIIEGADQSTCLKVIKLPR